MKKTFALVLAVAMVLSLAAVSFAADPEAEITLSTEAMKYKSDDDIMKAFSLDSGEYGKSAYYMLYEDGNPITEYKQIEKLKVKAKWEMGEDYVKSINIAKKFVKELAGVDIADDYYYFVEIATNSDEIVSDADVIGTLTFNRKADKDDGVLKVQKDCEVDIAFNLFYEKTYLDAKNYKVEGDNVYLKWDTNYALKFDYDDVAEITFGYENGGYNEGTFNVDCSGQGKIFFKYDTKANDDIVAANPGVVLKFVNFNNPKFNRTGEYAYEMEDGVAAYQIIDGVLTAIPGCEYDEADETFYFKTRTLGSYVFASAELVQPKIAVETPAVDGNPTTGAAA